MRSCLPLIAAFFLLSGCDKKPEPEIPPVSPEPSNLTNTDKDFIGMTKKQADVLAKERGVTTRVVEEDGKQFPGTMDYRPDRVNLTIEKGKIVATRRG